MYDLTASSYAYVLVLVSKNTFQFPWIVFVIRLLDPNRTS